MTATKGKTMNTEARKRVRAAIQATRRATRTDRVGDHAIAAAAHESAWELNPMRWHSALAARHKARANGSPTLHPAFCEWCARRARVPGVLSNYATHGDGIQLCGECGVFNDDEDAAQAFDDVAESSPRARRKRAA